MSKQEKKGLVPERRFPEFRDKGKWEERQLGDFLSESRLPGSKGNVAKKITVKLWGNGVFEKNEAVQGSINTQYFRRKSGQFIYSKLDFLNQAFGVIPPSLDNFETTVDLPCFDIANGLNSVFLLEYVKRRGFYERLGETADGSRKARRIHAETFLSFPIALPTAPEQQKIAECLTSVDELITAQTQKLDALKTHKKGLMQQLFPGEGETAPKLRFPEFRDKGEWEENSLGNVCSSISSGSDKSDSNGDYHLYGSTGIIGKTSSGSYDGNFILVARVGANAGLLTRAKGKFGVTDNTLALVLKKSEKIDFIYYSLDRLGLNRMVFGSGQPLITGGQLKSLDMFLPQPEEQQKIADCLTSIDELISNQAKKVESLKIHKKGLMQQLFPVLDEVNA